MPYPHVVLFSSLSATSVGRTLAKLVFLESKGLFAQPPGRPFRHHSQALSLWRVAVDSNLSWEMTNSGVRSTRGHRKLGLTSKLNWHCPCCEERWPGSFALMRLEEPGILRSWLGMGLFFFGRRPAGRQVPKPSSLMHLPGFRYETIHRMPKN